MSLSPAEVAEHMPAPETLYQMRGPGFAVRFAAIYTPERPRFMNRNSPGERFLIVLDADHSFASGEIVGFVRRNKFQASSGFRPRVTPVGHTVEELAHELAMLDATNVSRDRFFSKCREIVAHVAPYDFNFGHHSGRALGLKHLEVSW